MLIFDFPWTRQRKMLIMEGILSFRTWSVQLVWKKKVRLRSVCALLSDTALWGSSQPKLTSHIAIECLQLRTWKPRTSWQSYSTQPPAASLADESEVRKENQISPELLNGRVRDTPIHMPVHGSMSRTYCRLSVMLYRLLMLCCELGWASCPVADAAQCC